MSRILRRPMFRGGRVDSRGTGITSNLGYQAGGRVGFSNGGSGEYTAKNFQDYKDYIKFKESFQPQLFKTNKIYSDEEIDTMVGKGKFANRPWWDLTGISELGLGVSGPSSDFIQGLQYEKTDAGKKDYRQELIDERDELIKKSQEYGMSVPEGAELSVAETLETGTGNGNGNVTGDVVKKLSDEEKMKANQELFAKMLDKKGARIEDASNMALSFAGKAFEDEATVKSAFGKFFEEESKRPSSTRKIDQSAAALAINDYIAGKRSAEQTELFLEKLKLSQGSLADKYNEARKVENNKGKAFATALYNKEGKDLKQVNKIPESIDDIKELNLNNGDIILAPNEVNGNKVLSVLQVIISSNGNVSTKKYFPDL
jgi:hypothetical protein